MTLFPNIVLAGVIAYYAVVHFPNWWIFWYCMPSITVLWPLATSRYIKKLYFEMVTAGSAGNVPSKGLLS